MKKLFLFCSVMVIALTAGAQLRHPVVSYDLVKKMAPENLIKKSRPAVNCETVIPGKPGEFKQGPKRVIGSRDVWYDRPAGAYPFFAVTNAAGTFWGYYDYKMFFTKPYEMSTLKAHIRGADDIQSLIRIWEYYPDPWNLDETEFYYDENLEYSFFNDFLGVYYLPMFHAIEGTSLYDGVWHSFQSTYDGGNVNRTLSLPTTDVLFGEDGLYGSGYKFYWSQKTFVPGGLFGDASSEYTFWKGVGAPGIDPNTNSADAQQIYEGRFFGKNSGIWQQDYNNHWYQSARVDGFAQIFEKPDRPYLLKDLAVEFFYMSQDEPVEMECKVYKLEEVPEYDDDFCVALPYVPGELIATGRATLKPEKIDQSYQQNRQFVVFTLYGEEDGMEYELTPTIDSPIMVTFEGYNDIPALKNFTAMISSDYHTDEGYGETAYILYEDADENHEFHGDYIWLGLNNLFYGESKTGFNVGLNIDYPFLKMLAGDFFVEEDEYTFPASGGEMHRSLTVDTGDGDETFEVDGITFWSWYPTAEGDWQMTYNGSDVLPDWLDIQLTDGEELIESVMADDGSDYDMRIGIEVLAKVTAKPLPANVDYREATIRFEIPGEYRYFTFKQGVKEIIKGDVDNDGEITIADVTMLIDMLLDNTEFTQDLLNRCDANEDSQVDIADAIAIIDKVLG